jgi:hypothetical protein
VTSAILPAPWHDALTRRLRSLLKSGPLHRLRTHAGRHDALRDHDDPAALCMKVLEVLVDALGTRPGATRSEVEDALLPLLAINDTVHGLTPDPARHREVVSVIIGALLNDTERRQAFTERYLDFEEGRPLHRTMSFRLVSEHETLSGDIVLKPEADGINLFLRSLDIALEDAQAATEAVIRSQLDRGRLDLALQSAREAQIRSIQFDEKLRTMLRRTERDVGHVDWRHEVPALLEEALGHLDSRLQAERTLRETIVQSRDTLLGTPEAEVLVRIGDLLEDCYQRHLALHRPLINARELFLKEQERQRFAPLPLTPLPALETEILHPLLTLSQRDALHVCTSFEEAIAPPTAPVLLDVELLWTRLLRPPRETTTLGRELDKGPLEFLVETPPRFPAPLCAEVDARLSSLREPLPLDTFLQGIETLEAAHFTVLRCLQLFAPEQEPPLPLGVQRLAGALSDERFAGDSLLLVPKEVSHGS